LGYGPRRWFMPHAGKILKIFDNLLKSVIF